MKTTTHHKKWTAAVAGATAATLIAGYTTKQWDDATKFYTGHLYTGDDKAKNDLPVGGDPGPQAKLTPNQIVEALGKRDVNVAGFVGSYEANASIMDLLSSLKDGDQDAPTDGPAA